MDTLVEYFSDMPSLHRAALLVGGIALWFIVEGLRPMKSDSYKRGSHAATNLFFTATTGIIYLPLTIVLLAVSDWTAKENFGIVQWIDGGHLVDLVLGLVILDFFAAWLAHYCFHRYATIWRFHLIHHIDQHLDTTSANRHHPGESVIRFAFAVVGVAVVGAPLWVAVVHQSLSAMISQFNHSNVEMPAKLDRALRLVICTPNMHRSHHHYRQPYSDTNFGNVFSFYDRLLGTYSIVDNHQLVYGIDTYMDKDNADDVLTLLAVPFGPYRRPPQYQTPEDLS